MSRGAAPGLGASRRRLRGRERPVLDDRGWLRRLIVFGALYNVVEGALSIGAGVAAGSVVLVAFGLDSGIEVTAGLAAWRHMRRETTEEAETRLSRVVGWTFLALAAYVVVQSVHDLARGNEVAPSLLGLGVTGLSLLVMPVLGLWKLRLARRIGSRGLVSEAKETIACVSLSFFAVAGVGIRYLGGPSWIDAAAGLLMVPWLVREGLEGVRARERGRN